MLDVRLDHPREGCFQRFPLKGRYTPDDKPRDTFLLPLLKDASEYKRAAGFFSSSSLAAAADGLEPFIKHGGHIRLVVNHQLSDEDVDAVQRGLDLRDTVHKDLTKVGLSAATLGDPGEPNRLRLLCTLVALGQVDILVAVPADEHGRPLKAEVAGRIHHAKFGVFADRCDPRCRIAFEGSNNESLSGWLANYETYDAYESWDTKIWQRYGAKIEADFDRHWNRTPPAGWAVVDLPQAAYDGLLANAEVDLTRRALEVQGREDEIDAVVARILIARGEQQPSDPLADLNKLIDAPRQQPGVGIGSSVVAPWPHQFDVARKVVSAWPCSRLFSDEVGLGKTIEIGLVLRDLLISGKVERALLLVPSSVIDQWQSELWEKFTLPVPILDRTRLVWPDGSRANGELEQPVEGNRWDAADVMLASSHLARRAAERPQLIRRHWDLVLVDEAHHARRRGGNPRKNDPNALLQLLRRMRDANAWDGVLLASATPMQMHAHEAYDLLDVLGLPGPAPDHPDDPSWRDVDAEGFVRYFSQLTVDDPNERDWRHLIALARSHFAAFPGHNPHLHAALQRAAADGLVSRKAAKKIPSFHEAISLRTYQRLHPNELTWLDAWLREHTPMRTLVHRNTRHLLRAYRDSGVIPAEVVIPHRKVRDLHLDFDDHEQRLYDRIESWIKDRYAAVQAAAAAGDRKARALGFILTVYRRRLTSSFHAITLSLRRRRALLAARQGRLLDLAALIDDDDRIALEDVPDGLEHLLNGTDPDHATTQILGATADEVAELDAFIDALESRPNYDSKLGELVEDLREQLGTTKPDGRQRQAIVFTQFTDTMDSLREQLAAIWPGKVACYSGRGGEFKDPATGNWRAVDKATIKTAFRNGDYRILLGTDAMSEGLNLQTCDLLYNLDLPWNFMRIEQRIGRIDRIGGHPTVHVVNLLVRGTVEERIYSGIRDDFADFEAIVGAAQPVLAQTEDAIRTAALATGPNQDDLLAQQAKALIHAAREAEDAAVNLDTFHHDINAWKPAEPLSGEDDQGTDWLDCLRETLTNHPIMGQRFEVLGSGLWRYEDDRGHTWTVTFDRKIADDSGGSVALFAWGHPAFPGPSQTPASSTAAGAPPRLNNPAEGLVETARDGRERTVNDPKQPDTQRHA